MKYSVLCEEKTSLGVVALIERGEKLKEYAVVTGLDHESGTWGSTHSYCDYEYNGHPTNRKAEVLQAQLEEYNHLVLGCKYLPRKRLMELATLFKDGLLQDDEDSAYEYFEDICEMSEEEKDWFGLEVPDFIPTQIQTERGLVYVKELFLKKEDATAAGYSYAFNSKEGKLYSKCTGDDGLHHVFAIVKEDSDDNFR